MKININGISVYLEGDKKNSSIIFIHGFPYDHTMWKSQIDEFSKNYFCVSFDIRGLGDSHAGDGQFTMESFVDDLEMLMSELELNRPVLCGLSMGGYISLRALERMEDKFSAAILMDTKSGADDNAGKIKRAGAIKKINNEGNNNFVKEFVTNCFGKDFIENKSAEVDKIIQTSWSFSSEGIKGSLLAMAARTDTTEYLSNIKIPALLVCGEEDKLTPPDVMKEMSAKIKNSEFVIIKNAGHMTPVENPIEVNAAIKTFLDKNSL